MSPFKCISSIHFLAISCIYMQDFQCMFRFMTDEIPSRYPVEWQVIGWHLSDAFPLFISYQFPVHFYMVLGGWKVLQQHGALFASGPVASFLTTSYHQAFGRVGSPEKSAKVDSVPPTPHLHYLHHSPH